jgi:hypothetical protein
MGASIKKNILIKNFFKLKIFLKFWNGYQLPINHEHTSYIYEVIRALRI